MPYNQKIPHNRKVSYKRKLKAPYKLFLGTLANRVRLDILHTLFKGPKTVTEITKETDYDQTTISHNLKRLTTCSFVFNRKEGKKRIYYINSETIRPLLKLIDKHAFKYCIHLCEVEK